MRDGFDIGAVFTVTAYINLLALNENPDRDYRFFLFADHGIDIYSNGVMVSPAPAARPPGAGARPGLRDQPRHAGMRPQPAGGRAGDAARGPDLQPRPRGAADRIRLPHHHRHRGDRCASAPATSTMRGSAARSPRWWRCSSCRAPRRRPRSSTATSCRRAPTERWRRCGADTLRPEGPRPRMRPAAYASCEQHACGMTKPRRPDGRASRR